MQGLQKCLMEGNPEIYCTPKAKETFQAVYYFILQKFGQKSAEKFIIKAEETIALIALHPFMFKASTLDDHVPIGLITKQCSLFSLISEKTIHLLYFWDNRQDPLFKGI